MDSGGSNLENIIDRILVSARDLKEKLENSKEPPPYGMNPIEQAQYYRETRMVKKLENENLELRQALEDHQYGLEFIMSKYRSQVVELINLNKAENNATPPNTINLKRNNSLD